MTFTYTGTGKTPLSANDNVAGVSEYLFAFSCSRDGAANKQQFLVPQLEHDQRGGAMCPSATPLAVGATPVQTAEEPKFERL